VTFVLWYLPLASYFKFSVEPARSLTHHALLQNFADLIPVASVSGLKLFTQRWLPKGEPKALICIVSTTKAAVLVQVHVGSRN
jgi:hypothetical protein